DSAGGDDNGTLVNGTVWNANGNINGALAFDGDNDYVDVDDGTFGIDSTQALTVSCWIKKDASMSDDYFAILEGPYFAIRTKPDLQIKTVVATTGNSDWVDHDTVLANDTWHHLALSFSDNESITYINGSVVLGTERTGDLQLLSTTKSNVRIGGDSISHCTDSIYGLIDDVRIYNRALSAAEIAALHRIGQ
ncbi:MAG: LamG domain-containing protein, partial [bacterium]|nr:LamG domain-containing protein [bacterium]